MGRTESLSAIEKKLAKLENQEAELAKRKAQLNAQAADARNRAKARERKQRTHMLIVLGGLVESHILHGDWTKADVAEFEAYLMKYGKMGPAQRCCRAEERTAAEANADVRAWEKEKAEQAKAERARTKKLAEKALADAEKPVWAEG